jgi:putative SOS response-associated peptidase YedK
LRALGFTNINAKAEGIEGKPAFREAFQRRRCLVPVDSFYDWKKTAEGKEPYAIALAEWGLMALAGRWENCAIVGHWHGLHQCANAGIIWVLAPGDCATSYSKSATSAVSMADRIVSLVQETSGSMSS